MAHTAYTGTSTIVQFLKEQPKVIECHSLKVI